MDGPSAHPLLRPGSTVVALPTRARPRLYVPAATWRRRWRGSAFYPAFRPTARMWRWALRTAAVVGWPLMDVAARDAWPVAAFVDGLLPPVADVVVMLGRDPRSGKSVGVLLDADSSAIGYLKYADGPETRARLRHEEDVLRQLPPGVGPELLRRGELCGGEALLLSPIIGRPLPPSVRHVASLAPFLGRLMTSTATAEVDEHPKIAWLREAGDVDIEAWLAPLRGRRWPVVVQHGDFAPWNILVRPDGSHCAVDWEQGGLAGFPYFDQAYFVLQVAALIHRWSPRSAHRHAVRALRDAGVGSAAADALVRLTALDAFLRGPGKPLERWRRAVWQCPVCGG